MFLCKSKTGDEKFCIFELQVLEGEAVSETGKGGVAGLARKLISKPGGAGEGLRDRNFFSSNWANGELIREG